MEKKYIIGGLAVVGTLALIAYLKPKTKLNSDGFFNASGIKDNEPNSNLGTTVLQPPTVNNPTSMSAQVIPMPFIKRGYFGAQAGYNYDYNIYNCILTPNNGFQYYKTRLIPTPKQLNPAFTAEQMSSIINQQEFFNARNSNNC